MQVGVDIGGSLTKIVTVVGGERQYTLLEHTDPAEIAASLTSASLPPDSRVFLTGCGAAELAKLIVERRSQPDITGHLLDVSVLDELESFCAGARELVHEADPLAEPFVLTSMGTGTSVFYVSRTSGTRAAGTGVGGGTITGLGRLLTGTGEFTKIMDLASTGRRQHVDLMVSDLYRDAAASPVLSALTASNFGLARYAKDPRAEDVASAIVQMVIESVAVLSIQVARTHSSKVVFVAGSPSGHPLIRGRFTEIGEHLGHEFAFLRHGAFCGALGAILNGASAR